MIALHCISTEDRLLLGFTEPKVEECRIPKFDIGDTLRKMSSPAEWLDILNRNDRGYYVSTAGNTPRWVELDYVEKYYELWQEKD